MAAPINAPMLVKSPSRSGVPHHAAADVPLLQIKGLKTHFKTDDGWLHAVDGVDLRSIAARRSASSASRAAARRVTAMSVLRLLPMPPGKIVAGEVLWQGRDLLAREQRRDARASAATRSR